MFQGILLPQCDGVVSRFTTKFSWVDVQIHVSAETRDETRHLLLCTRYHDVGDVYEASVVCHSLYGEMPVEAGKFFSREAGDCFLLASQWYDEMVKRNNLRIFHEVSPRCA